MAKTFSHQFPDPCTVYGLYRSRDPAEFGMRPSPTSDLFRVNLDTTPNGVLPGKAASLIKETSARYFSRIIEIEDLIKANKIPALSAHGTLGEDGITLYKPMFPDGIAPQYVNTNVFGASRSIQFNVMIDDIEYKKPTRTVLANVCSDKYFLTGVTGVFDLRINPSRPNTWYLNFTASSIRMKQVGFVATTNQEVIPMPDW